MRFDLRLTYYFDSINVLHTFPFQLHENELLSRFKCLLVCSAFEIHFHMKSNLIL